MPLFLASPAQKYWRHEPDAERHLLGPLTEPALLVVYGSTFLFTFSLGLLEVGYPGFATALGIPAFSGVLLGINSLGSAAGGLAYGAMHRRFAVDRLAPRLLVMMALPIALQALVASPWLLTPLAFVAGLLIAPVFTVFTTLVTANAPSRYATEAFTWSSTCIISGVGAGNAIGGRLLESGGPAAAFVLSGLMALAAAATATMSAAKRSTQSQ